MTEKSLSIILETVFYGVDNTVLDKVLELVLFFKCMKMYNFFAAFGSTRHIYVFWQKRKIENNFYYFSCIHLSNADNNVDDSDLFNK